MAYKSSRFSNALNQELEVRAMGILAESPQALTIEEICSQDMKLSGYTPQKMSRVLGNLVEQGFVVKSKSKTSKRMVYMSVQQLVEQGYNLNEVVY